MLSQGAKELHPSIQREISSGYHVIMSAHGDVNLDEFTNDVIIVLQRDSCNEEARPLLLFLQNARGEYNLKLRNDSVVACCTCGGSYGDPLIGIEIEDGHFMAFHEGGTRNKWNRHVGFLWDDEVNSMVLDSIDISWIDRLSPNENYHVLKFGQMSVVPEPLSTFNIDREFAISSVVTTARFPHASARDVYDNWMETLVDTAILRPEWRTNLVATELPVNLKDGTLYIVQSPATPITSDSNLVYESYFWVVQDSVVDDGDVYKPVINKVLLTGVGEYVEATLNGAYAFPTVVIGRAKER